MAFKIQTVKVNGVIQRNSQNMRVPLEAIPAYARRMKSFKKIAKGTFAMVYSTRNPGTVIRVCDTFYDRGHYTYIRELSKLKKENPYLPKIHSAILFKFDGRDNILVVEMEALKPLPEYKLYPNLSDYDEDETDIPEAAYITNYLEWQEAKGTEYWLLEVDKELQAARKLIRSIASRYRLSSDFHAGNIMMRKDGQLVLTDPLFDHNRQDYGF